MNDWFEIFRTGEHTDSCGRARVWSEADLDKIAESYDPAEHEAPIVIGHPETNAPAYGWVEKLKRVGESLFALAKNVAPEFEEALKQNRFKKRSVSLYSDGTLRHIGFLGAAIPAVKGLRDISFSDENDFAEYEFAEEENGFDPAERDAYLVKFTESEERRLRAEAKLKELEDRLRMADFRAFLNEKSSAGILTPAQSEKLLAIANDAHTYDFSEQGNRMIAPLKEFVETMLPLYTGGEIAVKKREREDTLYRSPAQIIAEEITRSAAAIRNPH